MLKYLVAFALIAHCIWAKPLHQHGDLASHVVIVTPQAQVHLEPLSKYGAPTFIHHLTPLARIAAPHDETIVYVPASAAAPILPIDALAQHVGRSSGVDLPLISIAPQLKQTQIQGIQAAFEQAQATATSAQQAAQEGFGQISEQFSEAAASFSPAAFFPQPAGSQGSQSLKEKSDKLNEKLDTPANTQPLLAATGRHYYAFAPPARAHIIDFVPGAPVIVSPISALRARSLEYVPLDAALPLPENAKAEQGLLSQLKDEDRKDKLNLNADDQGLLSENLKLESLEKRDNLQLGLQEQPAAALLPSSNTIAGLPAEPIQPLLKSIVDDHVDAGVELKQIGLGVDPVVGQSS